MRTFLLPLSTNRQVSTRDPLYVRKLLISDFVDNQALANPPEFLLKFQIFDVFSDLHFAGLPQHEIRLPVPVINESNSEIVLKTHAGQEARLDAFKFAVDCEKRNQDTGLAAIPYFLVYRFPNVAVGINEAFITVMKTQRIPVDQFFCPLFSYGKLYHTYGEQRIPWTPTAFRNGDTFQIEDVSNDLIAQLEGSVDQYFPSITEPPHRWLTHDGWIEECRLEATIQNPLAGAHDGELFLYFVIAGILSNDKEFSIFDANWQSIPIR